MYMAIFLDFPFIFIKKQIIHRYIPNAAVEIDTIDLSSNFHVIWKLHVLIFVFVWAILASSETVTKTNTKKSKILADLFKENTNHVYAALTGMSVVSSY